MGNLAAFTISMLLAPLSAAWSGYVLSTVWGWFVVDALHVPALGVWQAAGIALWLQFATGTYGHTARSQARDNKGRPASEVLSENVSYAAIVPLFILGFGALFHAFA